MKRIKLTSGDGQTFEDLYAWFCWPNVKDENPNLDQLYTNVSIIRKLNNLGVPAASGLLSYKGGDHTLLLEDAELKRLEVVPGNAIRMFPPGMSLRIAAVDQLLKSAEEVKDALLHVASAE